MMVVVVTIINTTHVMGIPSMPAMCHVLRHSSKSKGKSAISWNRKMPCNACLRRDTVSELLLNSNAKAGMNCCVQENGNAGYYRCLRNFVRASCGVESFDGEALTFLFMRDASKIRSRRCLVHTAGEAGSEYSGALHPP